MKSYQKPMINFEEYSLNDRVSTCTPTTFIPPIDVKCNIKSSEVHGVFDTSQNPLEGFKGCVIDESSITFVTLGKSNEDDITYTTYALWYGSMNGQPEEGEYNSDTGLGTGDKLMEQLKQVGYGPNPGSSNGALHAGVASTELLSAVNAS